VPVAASRPAGLGWPFFPSFPFLSLSLPPALDSGGADEVRTRDPLLAKQVLSHLSYSPWKGGVGLGRLELPTSRLSGVRSGQLSYRPSAERSAVSDEPAIRTAGGGPVVALRKEVIQPQVLLQLPCYDFTPITRHTLGPCPLAVGAGTSSTAGFHDVTGGVYKARERIHRGMLILDY
jgi:hypothetical protein